MHSRRRLRLITVLGLVCFGLCLVLGGLWLSQNPVWLIKTGLVSVNESPLRKEYEREVAALADRARDLEKLGVSLPEIAKTLHRERRELGVRYKNRTPEALRERIYEANRKRYADPLGPSFEYLVQKHTKDGVTDYRAIIIGASRTNTDVNQLLGGR